MRHPLFAIRYRFGRAREARRPPSIAGFRWKSSVRASSILPGRDHFAPSGNERTFVVRPLPMNRGDVLQGVDGERVEAKPRLIGFTGLSRHLGPVRLALAQDRRNVAKVSLLDENSELVPVEIG